MQANPTTAPISDKTALFTLMQRGALVITPNNRLSRALMTDFAWATQQRIQAKPLCLSYAGFLQYSFKKRCHHLPKMSHPLVLTSQQSRYLWRQIVAKTTKELCHEGLVQALEEAWTRCHGWQIDFHHASFAHTPQTRQFQQWAFALQEELSNIGAITAEQIVAYLLSQDPPYQYPQLVWACFDDYTPQQLALQAYFAAQGSRNDHYDLAAQASSPLCYAAKDDQDEYRQLIHWLKERLARQEKEIAVVVPNLQSEAARLKRLLQQELAEPFNISLGQPLSDYPLVAHALSWLALDGEELSVEQAKSLLHSPYLAYSKTEMLARAQFGEENLILQERYFRQATFISELSSTVPKLARLLKGLISYPEKDSLQAWMSHFSNRLSALGFPGEYALNSASYQCYQRFLSLFDEFKQFALLKSEMTKLEALAVFKNLAETTVFQAKNEQARIQILGLLEAAGCCFDSLWVTGLTDLCLPQKARPSAFIPIALQGDRLMPYASPESEFKLAQKRVSRLGFSSSQVVFSYPQLQDDRPNRPSPLIADFPSFPAYAIKAAERASLLVEFVEAYELPLGREERPSGGTVILANQAKCPFRAFAAHRLHAKAALSASEGPDVKERGQIIHQVMELIWQSLQNQQTLLALDTEELEVRIEEAIRQVLAPVVQRRTYSFPALIQDLELIRLKRLVYADLDWERQRPAFAVEALEQVFTICLGGIDFIVRVDRLDKLAQGNTWVIDYKSSLPARLPWKKERPQEPQLLLYALLDETIDGLLFVQLKTGQLTCKGLSATAHPLPGLAALKEEEDWADYRQHWQAQLNELAQEFSQGRCQPQPASAAICQICDFQSLCRLNINLKE